MYTFLTSAGVVAISEMGDKTQLLALILAVRFRRPIPIIFGMFVATMANHTAAALAGEWVAATADPTILRWALGILFLVMAGWVLIPDKFDPSASQRAYAGGAFLATTVAFFLAEIGDKTQIATAGLAAQFGTIFPVVIGTTLGMMLADVPVVFIGDRAAHRINLKYVRWATSAVFLTLSLFALANLGGF